MVPLAMGLRIREFPYLDDANFPFHEYCSIEVQYLPIDLAHQERKSPAALSLCYDDRFGSHEH